MKDWQSIGIADITTIGRAVLLDKFETKWGRVTLIGHLEDAGVTAEAAKGRLTEVEAIAEMGEEALPKIRAYADARLDPATGLKVAKKADLPTAARTLALAGHTAAQITAFAWEKPAPKPRSMGTITILKLVEDPDADDPVIYLPLDAELPAFEATADAKKWLVADENAKVVGSGKFVILRIAETLEIEETKAVQRTVKSA